LHLFKIYPLNKKQVIILSLKTIKEACLTRGLLKKYLIMKKTPLYESHKELGAHMVPFAGFEMPVFYKSIKEEYEAVRHNSGVFDISHMAAIAISSKNLEAISFINSLTCRDIEPMQNYSVQYNAIMLPEGGLLDDITIYRIDQNHYYMVVNASNKDNVLDYLSTNQKNHQDVTIRLLENSIFIAVQGKNSETLLKKAGLFDEVDFNNLFYYEFASLKKDDTFISRTGYTGEDGFEFLLDVDAGATAWKKLIDAGAIPCGLGARDILRMEMFYPLYGNELNRDRTPLESSLKWIFSNDKEFMGKEVALKKGVKQKICGFLMKEKGAIPRTGYKVMDPGGQQIGVVTSGGFSFQWNCGFGIAYLNHESAKTDTPVSIEIRDKLHPATLYTKSPYQGSIKKRARQE